LNKEDPIDTTDHYATSTCMQRCTHRSDHDPDRLDPDLSLWDVSQDPCTV